MTELYNAYQLTFLACGAMGALMLVQLTISDILGIKAKHLPGSPVEADHNNSLFRASRVVANTNESIAVFVLLVLFALGVGADPTYTGYASAAYVAARAVYAVCYYTNLQMARSTVFGVSVVALIALLIVGAFF